MRAELISVFNFVLKIAFLCRRGIGGITSSRVMKGARAGSMQASGVDDSSMQDESSLDGEENSSEK